MYQKYCSKIVCTEGDQEKDGNRPEPKKQKKQKTEREGDKGKRKGKSPRTEELVPSIMQKSGFLLSTHYSPNVLDCFGFERCQGVLRQKPFHEWQANVAITF